MEMERRGGLLLNRSRVLCSSISFSSYFQPYLALPPRLLGYLSRIPTSRAKEDRSQAKKRKVPARGSEARLRSSKMKTKMDGDHGSLTLPRWLEEVEERCWWREEESLFLPFSQPAG